jgi:hypothetical protein
VLSTRFVMKPKWAKVIFFPELTGIFWDCS